MLRNRLYKPMLLALAALFFCGVFKTQQWLNNDRKTLGFTKLEPLKNAPPMLAFTTVALGGFRGLIANFLWIRASDLQEDEKFFEMVQLADWITKLEPHFVQVWNYQAWNMAFNISVKFSDYGDRWRWVQRGINLLRDEALPLNPDEALLYRDLSWMYQFKIGDKMDDANQYYKQAWAGEMQELFHGKANFEELTHPTTPEAESRAKLLREKYKMDPKIMKDVDEAYGPLEWRLADAHAIYWAELGRRLAKPKDKVMDRRAIYQSMRRAFFSGKLTELGAKAGLTNRFMMVGPNLDLMEKVVKADEILIAEETPEDRSQGESFEKGARNFLREAVLMLYVDGRQNEAAKWFDYLKGKYPGIVETNISVNEYALARMGVQLAETDHDKITGSIEGLLRQAYVALAQDRDDSGITLDRMARDVWNQFTEKTSAMSKDRLGLEPLAILKKKVLEELLDPETGPIGSVPALADNLRAKLNLPPPSPATNAPPPAASHP